MDVERYFLIPFYEYMKTIIGLTALQLKNGNCNDKHFEFNGNFTTEFNLNYDNNLLLTESRKHKSNKFDVRLIMWFCKMEENPLSKKQNSMIDCFPRNLKIFINGQPIQLSYLPYDRSRRPGRMNPRVLDITNLIFDNNNCTHTCNIQWVQDDIEERFNFALFLVRQRSFDELSSVLMKHRMFSVQSTINLLMERIIIHPVNNKSNIEYMFQDRKVLNTSLICPISLNRIKIPVRGRNCTHLKCFDLLSFLIINFVKPIWVCPICDKKAFFCLLKIDGLIYSIINDKRSNLMDEIKFNENGQWKSYDEVTNENSETDNFYDIPEMYYSLKINNEQVNDKSKIQRRPETVLRTELNKDFKNILPISDWMSLKNEFISSNVTNMIASRENNTTSNGANSKCSPFQTLVSKKSAISISSQTNVPLNSKTRVFQENKHQTNLMPNPNNDTNSNNSKRTHEHSVSESVNEKEPPVKKPTSDSRIIPKVNVSKTVDERVRNDESHNKDSDNSSDNDEPSQIDKNGQNLYTSQIMQNQPYTITPTCPPYKISKVFQAFYRRLQNFSFDVKVEPYTSTHNGITSIPNLLKYNTYDKDMVVIKFNVAQRYKLHQLTGFIELHSNSADAVQEGKRVVKEIRMHVAKTLVKFSFLHQDLGTLQNNTMVLDITSKFDINMLLIEIQNTPATIAIEILYYETIVYPFAVYSPFNGLPQVHDGLFLNNISFLKFQHLNDEDINQLTVFIDIKVGRDFNNNPQMFEITIIDFEGKILLNESVCPRERILHFTKDVTGYCSESILGKKDSYEIIIKARQLTYGKMLIGFDIGQKIKSFHITHKHIVGYRDLAEEKWRIKYTPNVKVGHMKLINLIEAAFKPIRNLKPIKCLLGVARQDKIFTTKEKVWLVRVTYNQIRYTVGWEDTVSYKTFNKELNSSVTNEVQVLPINLPSTSSNTNLVTQLNYNKDTSPNNISSNKLSMSSGITNFDVCDNSIKITESGNKDPNKININNTISIFNENDGMPSSHEIGSSSSVSVSSSLLTFHQSFNTFPIGMKCINSDSSLTPENSHKGMSSKNERHTNSAIKLLVE